LYVNKEPIITNRNQAYFAELGTRGLQEESADPKENSPPRPNFAAFTYKE